jgi:hypothetical protein
LNGDSLNIPTQLSLLSTSHILAFPEYPVKEQRSGSE